jgi:phage terminase large subunit
MKFIQTTALNKILALKKRLKIIQGGTSASKTISILTIFIDRAQSRKGYVSSVVSETMPHLKRGAIRDFLNIMEGHGYYKDERWNRSDFIYTFETGSKIEFFSADSSDKVRGPRRNGDLFINECNNVTFDTYTQLAIRTEGDIYLDYNPVAEFWVHEEVIPKLEHDFIILTYKDNEGLPPQIVKEIESRQGNKNFWSVFGLGLLGDSEGKIYKDWAIIDEIPHVGRLERRCMDFGYSNDPSAIVSIYKLDGGFIFDEDLFQKGMSNKQLSDVLLNLAIPQTLVIADSAEPKSIDEIKSHGVNILPAEKGPDSVRSGIQLVQGQRISVTKRSVNIIKEYRNYLWETDKDGKILNEPEHAWSHSMDAIRYGMTSLIKKPTFKAIASPLSQPYYPELGI